MNDFDDCLSNETNHTKNLYYISKLHQYHAYFELIEPDCVSNIYLNYDNYSIDHFEFETRLQLRNQTLNPNGNDYICIDSAVPLPSEFTTSNTGCGCSFFWHLDAIDGDYWNWDDGLYNFLVTSNPNVDIYIIDSGILSTHNEFNSINFQRLIPIGETFDDSMITSSHGTHVAGIACGMKSGVGKNFDRLFDVPSCQYGDWTECSTQDTDDAFELIIENLEKDYNYTDIIDEESGNITQRIVHSRKRAVIVMSWGTEFSDVLFESYNGIFEEITELGGILVAATTNEAWEWNEPCDANLQDGPAGAQYVVTVGRQMYNEMPYRSGYGQCIDIYGPGVNIMSSVSKCDDCYDEYSGILSR